MKKMIAFVLILTVISIFFIFIGIISNNNKNADNKENTSNEMTGILKEEKPAIGNENLTGEESSNSGGGSGSSGGGSSSSGDSQGSNNNPEENESNQRELPADLYTKSCGSYFLEYGICAGVCPDGQCLVEGKSCYCRIV